MNNSLDPRVNRVELPENEKPFEEGEMLQWQTYEVFQQQNRGEQHVHVGVVHAPNPEMALLMAKEQFGRREQCANLWVVKTSNVHATSYDDDDMFQHAFDKTYREGEGYKVRDTIEAFKRDLDRLLAADNGMPNQEKKKEVVATDVRVVKLSEKKGKRRIIIHKK